MTNKITVMLEALGFDQASNQVKGFRQSVADADGVTGKFKAGATSAFDSLKANAGPAALAAGGALVAFGVHAVNAFTDTAKAAVDMGAATGLAVEDASRWIAVGDDFGITAEQLESGIGKIGKSLDSGKWEQYGIATRDAGGNARDTNDILADGLGMLSSIENETERARIGNELFGKGYANLAPLIGHTADEYRDMLGAVEDGQVITSGEAEKAERMRLAQDALADALQEVTLAVGEMVAEMAPAIESLSQMVGWATKLGGTEIGDTGLSLWTGSVGAGAKAIDLLRNGVDLFGESSSWVTQNVDAQSEAQLGLKETSDTLAGAAQALNDITGEAAEMYAAAKRAIEEKAAAHRAEAEALQQTIDAQRSAADATFALQDAQDTFTDTVQALDEKVKEAKGDQEELNRVYREAATDGIAVADATRRLAEEQAKTMGVTMSAKDSLDLWNSSAITQAGQLNGPSRDAILSYIGNVNGIPPEKISEIGAILDHFGVDAAKIALDNASVARTSAITADAHTEQAEADLNHVARNRTMNVSIVAKGGAGYNLDGNPNTPFAAGGFTGRGNPSDVAGIVHKGEFVVPARHVDQSTGLPKAPVAPGRSGPLIGQVVINHPVEMDAMAQRLNFLLAS